MTEAPTPTINNPGKLRNCDFGIIGLLICLGIWHLSERFVPESVSVFKLTHQFGWIVFAFLALLTVRELPALLKERKAEKQRQELGATQERTLLPRTVSRLVRANAEALRLILVIAFVFFWKTACFSIMAS